MYQICSTAFLLLKIGNHQAKQCLTPIYSTRLPLHPFGPLCAHPAPVETHQPPPLCTPVIEQRRKPGDIWYLRLQGWQSAGCLLEPHVFGKLVKREGKLSLWDTPSVACDILASVTSASWCYIHEYVALHGKKK